MSYLPLIFFFAAFIASLIGTKIVLLLLTRFAVFDNPNARSNHSKPVPRGGGIAMILVAVIFLMLSGIDPRIALAALLLCLISFVDDLRGLPVRIRLLVQLVAVVLGITTLHGRLFPAPIPLFLEWMFIAGAWLWIINLTNFMDGIDGITSMQTIAVMLGICLMCFVRFVLPVNLTVYTTIIIASVLGFYWYNRPPARLFMGDAGSIPLGFLTGYLLLLLAINGAWFAALILPAYYLSDATFTLLKRAIRREKVWQAHSEHAYQQAVRSGLSHAQVVCRITGLNMVLVVLAMLSSVSMLAGITLTFTSYLLTAYLLYTFTHVSASQ